jgi:hypothetical protein
MARLEAAVSGFQHNRDGANIEIALCWGEEVPHDLHMLSAPELPAAELQLHPTGHLP